MRKLSVFIVFLIVAVLIYWVSYSTSSLRHTGHTSEETSYHLSILGVEFPYSVTAKRIYSVVYYPLRYLSSTSAPSFQVTASQVIFHDDDSTISAVAEDGKRMAIRVPDVLVSRASSLREDEPYLIHYKIIPDPEEPFVRSFALTNISSK